jgi:uncharacterized OsmC-like protein
MALIVVFAAPPLTLSLLAAAGCLSGAMVRYVQMGIWNFNSVNKI